MQRHLPELAKNEYDVLIVGGGAAGAAAAREAALRGLKTALIERDDFGSGTSAHCFKVVHGGIRYLQHADVRRLRASCNERSVFLRLAPHLVKPLPFVIPTYGMGSQSKWLLGAAMLAYDALSADRNLHNSDPSRRIQRTRFFSRRETLDLFPNVRARGLTGAAAFEDGQMHNPPRLVLAFAMSAAQLGADVANYVEAERLLIRDKRCYGVAARDVLTGEQFDIRARVVLNATGPWAEGLLRGVTNTATEKPTTYSRDACFVINRRPTSACAVAIQGNSKDADAVVTRGTRHLFLSPWRDRTLVGVWHSIVPADPDAARLTRTELQSYIDEINTSHPGFDLRESEVERVDYGLVPFGDADAQGRTKVSFGKQSRLIDHRVTDGIAGLVTSVSVRYTVARLDAVNALGCVMKQIYRSDLDRFSPAAVAAAVQNPERAARGRSTSDPLPGGEFDDFERLLSHARRNRPLWMPPTSIDALVANYGTHMHRVVAMADADPALRRCIAGSHVTLAEVAYATRDEMVESMRDVVFRRTELGTAGHPGDSALDDVAEYLQQTKGWSDQRVRQERQAVDAQFERYLATKEPLRHIAPAPETEVAPVPALLTTAV